MMEVNLQHRDYALIAQNSRVGKKLTSWISVVHRQDLQISVGAIALNIMSSDRSTTRIGFYILSVFLGMLAALSYTLSVESPQVVEAAAGDDIVGYAWSSNIGWLSMNSKNPGSGGGNYGVDVDNFGRLSGYAWSSNIGWVSFNAGDVSGCPGGGACQGQVNSDYTVSGWARALSPTGAAAANAGGWDGWISLSGANYAVTVDSVTCDWDGWAWGSVVVGWLNFNGSGGNVLASDASNLHACPKPNLTPAASLSSGGDFDYAAGVWNGVLINIRVDNNGTGDADPSITAWQIAALTSGVINNPAITAGSWDVQQIDIDGVPIGDVAIEVTVDEPDDILEIDESLADNTRYFTFNFPLPDPLLFIPQKYPVP
jgi:hypothetical protein